MNEIKEDAGVFWWTDFSTESIVKSARIRSLKFRDEIKLGLSFEFWKSIFFKFHFWIDIIMNFCTNRADLVEYK